MRTLAVVEEDIQNVLMLSFGRAKVGLCSCFASD